MKYITILGQLNRRYIETSDSIYWLTECTQRSGLGFALLEKTWQGSYNIIRFHELDSMSLCSEFIAKLDELKGGK